MVALSDRIKKAHDLLEKKKDAKAKLLIQEILGDSALCPAAKALISNAIRKAITDDWARTQALMNLTTARISQATQEMRAQILKKP